MNFDWISFLIGLLAGWLLEWLIDWVYWRRGRASAGEVAALQGKLDAAEARASELQAALDEAHTAMESWQAKAGDLDLELDGVRAELDQCQTNHMELQTEFEQLSASNAELQNLVDAARIQAISRLTAIEGIDEETAGRLVDAGITSSDELVLADDDAVRGALGLSDEAYVDWSDRVKAGLAGLGIGIAAARVADADDEEGAYVGVYERDDQEDLDEIDAIQEQEFPEVEGDLIVEEVLETYDFDEDGEVDMVVETVTEGLDIDGDGEIDIVLDELIEADVLDEEAIAGIEGELEELEELDVEEAEAPLEGALRSTAVRIAAEPDDLTLINGIGPRFAEKLSAAGILTFTALAQASDEELDAAVEPQNWQKLDYESWRSQARTFAEVPLPQQVGDDLQLIEGIGPKYSALLREADILTFAELADSEPERLAEIIGAPAWRKVDYASWIAQAGLAAAGSAEELQELQEQLNRRTGDNLLLIHGLGETYADALRDAGINTYADLVAQTPEELAAIISAAGLRQADAGAWIEEAQLRMQGRRIPRRVPVRDYEDATMVSCPQDLESIEGVGVVYERRLYEAGVGSYWEVAQLSDEQLTDILEVMPFQDVDLAAIRASAMALAIESGTVNHVWDGSRPDDFEPFEGIGVIYERRLYNAGYCTYEALAEATPEELERVCRPPAFHKPDFAGWIATAQILAAAKGADEE